MARCLCAFSLGTKSQTPICRAMSVAEEEQQRQQQQAQVKTPSFEKELSKVVKKTATTFAPRSSTASKNPAVPGSTLYTVFELQGYASMAVGGLLAFNVLLPSDGPDVWRLMGMWSVWMFSIPSLRARDCSKDEKDALNYLFLLLPIINITVPLVWRSFAAVWAADIAAFVAIYAWKMDWLNQPQQPPLEQQQQERDESEP